MSKTTTTILATTAAALTILALAGCTGTSDVPGVPAPAATTTIPATAPAGVRPTTAPSPVAAGEAAAIGAPLSKNAAIAIRLELPADGSYAYQMLDGSWVKTNTRKLLPAAVQDAMNANASKLKSGTMSDGMAPGDAAVTWANGQTFVTGKQVVVIAYVLTSINYVNTMAWCALGDLAKNPADAIATTNKAQAIAETKALINRQPDAANWAIAVQ